MTLFSSNFCRYRLGRPSKQYAPWYEPVLKTANLGISIITLLKDQARVARLSFADVIKRLSEFKKDNHSYISSDPAVVERYVVVHGPIILQLFEEFPDESIRRSAFLSGLRSKMEERHHTKWLVKKKIVKKCVANLNPRAAIASVVSKRKAMEATTTRLIKRIWREYYSNCCPEDFDKEAICEIKEDEVEEQEDNEDDDEDDNDEEELLVLESAQTPSSMPRETKSCLLKNEIKWEGEPVGRTSLDEALYQQVIVHEDKIVVGCAVLVDADESNELPAIYFVEYMFEASNGSKMFHGRMMQRGAQTILGNTANEREVFLTNECMNLGLEKVKQKVVVDFRILPWGHQHRKDNANVDKTDRARAEERKKKGLPIEYYCKSLYWPEKGAFFSVSPDTMGLGSGSCNSCQIKKVEKEKEVFEVNSSKTGFIYNGTKYSVYDYVYVSPHRFAEGGMENDTFKGGRNVGLKPHVVCQVLDVIIKKETTHSEVKYTQVKVRRFYRPEDISVDKAYSSDIREVSVRKPYPCSICICQS